MNQTDKQGADRLAQLKAEEAKRPLTEAEKQEVKKLEADQNTDPGSDDAASDESTKA